MSEDKTWPLRVPRDLVTSGVYREFTSRDWRLYLTLLLHENNRTHKCWPSYSTISKLSGLSRSAISESLQHHKELGSVNAEGAKGKHSVYEICTSLRATSPQIKDRSRLKGRKRDSKGIYRSLNSEHHQSPPSGGSQITTSSAGWGSPTPQQEVLVRQVLRAEGVLRLIEIWLQKVPAISGKGWKRGSLELQPCLSQSYGFFLNVQRQAILALGLNRRVDEALTIQEVIKDFDARKGDAVSSFKTHTKHKQTHTQSRGSPR